MRSSGKKKGGDREKSEGFAPLMVPGDYEVMTRPGRRQPETREKRAGDSLSS